MVLIERAAELLRKGSMAVVYDGDSREGEADLMLHASFAKPEAIETLRKEAGGLICLAIGKEEAEALGLPFYTDILRMSNHPIAKMECSKTAYGDKPAFAIPVNHKGVYTGITDNDRSLTITKIAELVGGIGRSGEGGNSWAKTTEAARQRFMEEFYSPGHVFLLIGRGIENRRGHTELALELAKKAGLPGAMVLCEMLGKGKAMPKAEAEAFAERHGFVFIEGKDIAPEG